MFSTHSPWSRSKPIWVSFTDTLQSSFSAEIRSSVCTTVAADDRASSACVTLSPRRSRLAAMPRLFSSRTAVTAESMVSPATKREASRRASRLPRMNAKMRGCSLR